MAGALVALHVTLLTATLAVLQSHRSSLETSFGTGVAAFVVPRWPSVVVVYVGTGAAFADLMVALPRNPFEPEWSRDISQERIVLGAAIIFGLTCAGCFSVMFAAVNRRGVFSTDIGALQDRLGAHLKPNTVPAIVGAELQLLAKADDADDGSAWSRGHERVLAAIDVALSDRHAPAMRVVQWVEARSDKLKTIERIGRHIRLLEAVAIAVPSAAAAAVHQILDATTGRAAGGRAAFEQRRLLGLGFRALAEIAGTTAHGEGWSVSLIERAQDMIRSALDEQTAARASAIRHGALGLGNVLALRACSSGAPHMLAASMTMLADIAADAAAHREEDLLGVYLAMLSPIDYELATRPPLRREFRTRVTRHLDRIGNLARTDASAALTDELQRVRRHLAPVLEGA